MRWAIALASAIGAVLLACTPAMVVPPSVVSPSVGSPSVVVVPTAVELRRDLAVFASDSFRGRETGTPDERRAAAFLADRATALGLEPAGDSGFLQRVPLVRETIGGATRFTVRGSSRGATARTVDGLLPLIELGDGALAPRDHADGDLVFAGYATARTGGADDLARIPVAGHVVVVVNGAPVGADAARRAELESPAAVSVRLQRVLALHPAGVIMLLTGASADLYEPLRRQLAHGILRPAFESARDTAAGAAPPPRDTGRVVPMLLVGLPVRGSPLLPPRWPRDDRPQRLAAGHFSATLDLERAPVESYNVVAALRGSDPGRRESWVAFGAHYDHLGILAPVRGDSVAHGADDDGSGSVALLAVARAMRQSPPPRRSVLFVWHTGEEQGLLGSQYFTAHPTVPLDSVVALVNADMIGRNAPESLYVVGPGAAPRGQSRRLGLVVDSVNALLSPPFILARGWDTPTSPERIYFRGDAYHYAERGVPIVFFTTGPHADYHQVTDNASHIDYDKLAHVGRLLYALGEALADRDTPPR